MKKIAFLLAILGICSFYISDAQDITVADGTTQLPYFPLSGYHWEQSQHSQSIYPSSMLTELQGKYITTLTWYMVAAQGTWLDTREQTIRLGITTADNLNDGMINDNTSIVWTGPFSAYFVSDTIRIPLDTPFYYNGGNLLVEVIKAGSTDMYQGESFYGQTQSDIMSLNQVGTYYAPYTAGFLPKLTFTCQDESCSYPEFLEVSDIAVESATLSWQPGILGSANQYEVAYRSNTETEYTEVAVNDTFLTLTDLQPITTYVWKVRAVCSDTLSSDWSLESSFTTHRRQATIPYFCDFEDSTENVNWFLPINPDAEDNRWYTGSYVSYSGSHSLYVSSNGGATNLTYGFGTNYPAWAYREFVIDTVYPQYIITFQHRGYEHYTAYWGPPAPLFSIVPPVLQPDGSVRLSDNQSLPQDSVWMTHSYSFSVATPGTYRLYFDWRTAFYPNSGKPAASIDDISIEGIPCLVAHTLTATDITDTSAVLSWQYNCVDSPMGYEVGYKTAGDDDYTIFTVYDTTSVTLTGLTPNTTYYWRVKTLYDDSFATDWCSPVSFQTDVIWVHPIPYTCDFEDATENLAWHLPMVTGNNQPRWYIGHNTYSSANTSLYITTAADGSNNIYNSLVEAQLWAYRDLYFDPQYDTYELSFDAKVKGNPGYAFAQVFVGDTVDPTDNLAAQSMVLLDDIIGPTVNNNNECVWSNCEYTLDHTFAGHKRIFFLWQNHANNYRFDPAIAIDKIVVTGTSCPHPVNMVTDRISDTSARISWQGVTLGSPETYTVAYKAASDLNYTLIETSDTSLLLNNLQPLTHYTWKVRSDCSVNEHSEWSHEESFLTFRRLTTMPYYCDFEDPTVNAGWLHHFDGTTQQWCFGSAIQHNGLNTCYVSSDLGATCQTMDETYYDTYMYQDFLFDTTYSEYVLEFDLKTLDTTQQKDLSVYVVTPTSPTYFARPAAADMVGQVNFTDTLWHHVHMIADQSHSGIQRLVFRWEKENYYVPKRACAIDDISFKGFVVGRPYNLTSSNIKHNSALLTWEPNNHHAPAAYELAYRKGTDTTYTFITVTDTNYLVSSLTPNTIYHWKARAIATNNEPSNWSDEVTFCTAGCTPYYTGFEDEVDKIGWHVASVSYFSDTWVIGSTVRYDGASSIYISNDYGATNSSLTYWSFDIISVYRDIYIAPGAAEYQISFDYMGKGAEIQLQSLDSVGAPAVSVVTIPTSDQWQHHRFTIDSSYTGLYRLFLKKGWDQVPSKAGALDNLMVKASECPPPTPLATTLLTANAARLTWNRNGASSYQVAYKLQYDHNYVEIDVQDTTLLISDFQYDRPYFWKVRALCNGVYGDWSEDVPFNTTPVLPYFCDYMDSYDVSRWYYDVPVGVHVPGDDIPSIEWNYFAINALPNDNDNVSLHISSTVGEGSYHPHASACLWAYRDFCLSGSTDHYQISFDFKGLGQVGADFARVYLGPPTTPSGLPAPEGAEQLGGDFCMVPSWTHYCYEVDSTHTGLQRLYFQWRHDNSFGANPGGAFDNISVQVSDCFIPVHPETVVTTATTATLSWQPGNASALPTNYTVAYRLLSDTAFTEVNSDDTTILITGLQPDTYYYWWVRANCSATDHSLWSNNGYFATTQTTYATLPYECGFEEAEENASWSHLHVRGTNEWVVGTATSLGGDSSLYVSCDGGATNTYTLNSAGVDWVYRDIYFPPGNEEYELSFDFKGNSPDYAIVYLGKPEVTFDYYAPAGAESLGGQLYHIPDWQHFSFLLDSTHSGVQRLYFLWKNATYTVTQPPAAIDNIVITGNPCREPVDLMSYATADSAMLSWTMRFGGAGADYTVAVRSEDDSVYTYIHVSDTILVLHDLDSNTNYYWKVRQNCDTSCSIWSEESSFYTHNQIVFLSGFDTPGSISNWTILYIRAENSWCIGSHDASRPNGTMYVSSDGGLSNTYNMNAASDLWAYTDVYVTPGSSNYHLSFDFKGMGEANNDYLNVFVGPPAVPSGSATPVGAVGLQNIGMRDNWTHYDFAIDSTHSGIQRIYLLWHNNNTGGANPPASIDNLCLSRGQMPQLAELTATPHETATYIVWSYDGTTQPVSYTLAYAALPVDTVMTEITVYTTTRVLYGLLANTDYLCKVRANYADGSHSLWLMTQFHTQNSYAPAPYICDFEDVSENDSWEFVSNGTENQWTVGTATANGEGQSLYISNDDGITNAYNHNALTNAWAYRNIYLDPAQAPYTLYFDFKGQGEVTGTTAYDYAKVFIGPAIVPTTNAASGTVPPELTQLDVALHSQSDWGTHSVVIDNTHTGYLRLFLYWTNDQSLGNDPAAAFDNILLVSSGCTPPNAIVLDNISPSEVSFHFTDVIPFHHDWDVAIVPGNETLDETNAVTLHDEMSHTFSDLVTGIPYTLYVRTRCDETTFSEWISQPFVTDGVSTYQLEQAVSVYPNPSRQYVNILCQDGITISQIEVYDTYGRAFLSTEVRENPKRLCISELSSGMYLMRIITDQGVVTKTFIKQ